VPDPDVTRRRLAGAAVGGLALPLLAACGGGSGGGSSAAGPTSGGGASTPASGGGKPPAANALVAASGVPVGGGVILGQQNVVITQPTQGSFEGFSATCTHQGCQLANVAGGTINCGCHGSQFSIKDGSNVTGPLGSPAGSIPALGKIPVKVQGGSVVPG
jgi:nitrite reductase/ring-hydroxylating ferredoxin subunit